MEESNVNSELSRASDKGNPFRIPVRDEHLENEIALQWGQREYYRNFVNLQKAEILKIDAALGELFYRQKRRLSQPGRNGAWSAFLRQHNIIRNTDDRMILDYIEFFGLSDELSHRATPESLENRICQTAYRTADRLENMLKSPQSRILFVRCIADFFELTVDIEGDGVRLSIPPTADEKSTEI